MEPDKAYLSIVEWPGGVSEADQARALAAAAEMDPYHATLAVRRGFPQVIARLDALTAELAVERLREHRVVAFAPRQSSLEQHARARRIKSLSPALGSSPPMYLCEMWRDDQAVLNTADLFLIVRATLRAGESRTSRDPAASLNSAAAGYVIGGLPGAMLASHASGGVQRTTSTSLTEIMDLYLRDGTRMRINADKFSFAVLGPDMGFSDRQNAALLLKRLRHDAPRAIVDTSFEHFRCPPDIVRSHFSDLGNSAVSRTTEAPAFDFYSPWCAMMYRALLEDA